MTHLELEPKDAFVGAMVWAQTLVPDYVPDEHHALAHGVIAAIFYVAYHAWTLLENRQEDGQ